MVGQTQHYLPTWVGDDDTAFRTNRNRLGHRDNSEYVLGNIQDLNRNRKVNPVFHTQPKKTPYLAVRPERKKSCLFSPR